MICSLKKSLDGFDGQSVDENSIVVTSRELLQIEFDGHRLKKEIQRTNWQFFPLGFLLYLLIQFPKLEWMFLT